jgi:hypothetical protein
VNEPSTTADLLRRVADTVDHPTVDSLNVDIANLFDWAAAFEARVARLEQLVETVEHHGLLLARLLDGPETKTGRGTGADVRYRRLLDDVALHDQGLAVALDETVGERLAEARDRGAGQ